MTKRQINIIQFGHLGCRIEQALVCEMGLCDWSRGPSLTFLCDADGAAAHADPQSVDAGVYQVLSLRCCNHWGGRERGRESDNWKIFQQENTFLENDFFQDTQKCVIMCEALWLNPVSE